MANKMLVDGRDGEIYQMSYVPDVAVMRIYRLAIVDPWIAFQQKQFTISSSDRRRELLPISPLDPFQPRWVGATGWGMVAKHTRVAKPKCCCLIVVSVIVTGVAGYASHPVKS